MKKLALAALAAVLASAPAFADPQAGIEAFRSKQFDVALKELQPAAEKGDLDAMYYLGQMYASGFGVKKDLKQAVELYGKAAEQGHVPSQTEFGTALALGDGIKQDVGAGLKWLFIAAKTGDPTAKEYATRFARYMSRTVVLTARKEATDWQSAFEKKSGVTKTSAQ